jgi:hypothetical protein
LDELASSKLKFNEAMAVLLRYSLIEQVQETKGEMNASYATHPVVRQWARHS